MIPVFSFLTNFFLFYCFQFVREHSQTGCKENFFKTIISANVNNAPTFDQTSFDNNGEDIDWVGKVKLQLKLIESRKYGEEKGK